MDPLEELAAHAQLAVPRVSHTDLCWLLQMLQAHEGTSGGEPARLLCWVGEMASRARTLRKELSADDAGG